jgi:hypothetical protein
MVVTIDVKELPESLTKLKDDPYRSLAYYVRKDKWICRTLMNQTEFAEFLWADWFRKQPQLSDVKSAIHSPENYVDEAYDLAERASDKPLGFLLRGATCPREVEKLPKCATGN